MSRSNFFYISLILIIPLFKFCTTSKKSKSFKGSNSKINILASYGNLIYERESCKNCHTQLVEEENSELISLDGLGNKYPNEWHFYNLYDPHLVNPESEMPSFQHLSSEPFDKAILKKIIISKDLKINEDTLWNDLIIQADIISLELNRRRIPAYNSSAVALISYLQQIPSSKKKNELDSLERVEEMKKEEIWNKLLADSISFMKYITQNKDDIEEGRSLFEYNCSACHGELGGGMIGPNLTDDYWLNGGQELEIAKTIVNGIPRKGMISWKNRLSPNEVGEIVAYISSIRGTQPPNSLPPRGIKE